MLHAWYLCNSNLLYAVYGLETGEQNTPHIQGYFRSKVNMRYFCSNGVPFKKNDQAGVPAQRTKPSGDHRRRPPG